MSRSSAKEVDIQEDGETLKDRLKNSMNIGYSEFSFLRPILGWTEPLHYRLSILPETHGPRRRQSCAEKQDNLQLFLQITKYQHICLLVRNYPLHPPPTGCSLSPSFSSADCRLMGVYWLQDVLWLVFFEVFATKTSTNDHKFRKFVLDYTRRSTAFIVGTLLVVLAACYISRGIHHGVKLPDVTGCY